MKAGDEVVVYGDLKLFKNDKTGETTYELDKNNYLISINGETQVYRGLAVSGQKTAFTVGDTFEFGGKALQVWRGKADVDVTASATFSGYNMSTEGKQTVTVTVGEETVTYDINVRAAGGATGLVEYVSTFTDKNLNTKEKTMTWTSSLEANSFDSDLSRGVQFGAAKGEFTITGTGHESNVKKISVIISTNYAGNTISATVGGVAIGKQISLKKDNNYEIVFESTTELSGDIVFSVNDKGKSVYIKSITVNPAN